MSGYVIVMGEGHLGDDVLMELLDGERVAPENTAHLAGCEACTVRFKALEGAARTLGESLGDIQVPRLDLRPPRRPARLIQVPFAIAAGILALASVAAATPPIRHWIMDRLSPPTVQTPTAAPEPAAQPNGAGILASFAPGDTLLVIRIVERQLAGTLVLSRSASDRVSAQATAHVSGEELLVMPAELRIANARTSLADYRVTLPASVRTVRVLIAGAEVMVLNEPGLDRRISLR